MKIISGNETELINVIGDQRKGDETTAQALERIFAWEPLFARDEIKQAVKVAHDDARELSGVSIGVASMTAQEMAGYVTAQETDAVELFSAIHEYAGRLNALADGAKAASARLIMMAGAVASGFVEMDGEVVQ